MTMTPEHSIYQCPVCRQSLSHQEKRFVCPGGHSYDVAREGYVNLLLSNQKKTKNPGDSASMIESRISFLGKGFYAPLARMLKELLLPKLREIGRQHARGANFLDLGCGSGYYIGAFAESLSPSEEKTMVTLWGIDISKPAIQKASKKYPDVHFSVGSTFHLPYADESLDAVMSVFAPFDEKEVVRVLKKGGMILVVRPGPQHLKELAELLYGTFKLQGNSTGLWGKSPVTLEKTDELKYEIHLGNQEDLAELVNMTPYGWQAKKEKKRLIDEKKSFDVIVDFLVSQWRK